MSGPRSSNAWTDREIEILRAGIEAGRTQAQIAEALSRSLLSVKCRCHRLGFLGRRRSVASAAVSAEDIKEIVGNQVARAKKGDKDAIKFVFEQVLGTAAMKGATLHQHNYPAAPPTPARTQAVPGSRAKLDVIEARVRAGLPSCDPRDREKVDLT